MRAAGVTLDVPIEIDVGAHRCGAVPGAPAVALARQIAACRNLRFAGLQAYQVQHSTCAKSPTGARPIARAVGQVQATTRMLAAAGIPCDTVTGGGTGSYMFEAASSAYHELQAGSYIFMDADYARNEWTESGIPQFEHSLFVWTTVDEHAAPERAVVDAGLKASSVDSGMPRVADYSDIDYVKASDEHGVLQLTGLRASGRRQAEAHSRALRSDRESLRLVRVHPQRPGRGAVADHRARRGVVAAVTSPAVRA